MRLLGIFSILLGSLAAFGEIANLSLPTARWFFETSRNVSWLGGGGFPWMGWLSITLLIVGGGMMVYRSLTSAKNPITARRVQRFKDIKRGYYSLIILLALAGIAGLDQMVVGKRALAVKHNNEWTFPAFLQSDLKNKDFGITDETAEAPADYRKLKRLWSADSGNKVILPIIPFDPTGDTLHSLSRELLQREGIYHENGSRQPYWGLVAKYFDVAEAKMHLRFTMREGKLTGPVDGWNTEGVLVYTAEYKNGQIVYENYSGDGAKEDFLGQQSSSLRSVKYHPAPPIPEEGNWLGTTSQGYDVLAYLYGGLQVNFKAALIYLPIVYFIGLTIGLLMGYFGGWFDLLFQRFIEILSNMPFLFVVIIFSSVVPEQFKGLPIILTILIIFGWMGMTDLMRTAAYRDRERDYVAAAKVLGASTPRVIFFHLLPNTIAIIVTLVPFTMSALIFSLTALDYLGFGLPPAYATWGRLLNDGLSNLSAPWLVTSAFVSLVALLILITFIGEAVREALDPKKFTYYR